jgi:hypothetical protein
MIFQLSDLLDQTGFIESDASTGSGIGKLAHDAIACILSVGTNCGFLPLVSRGYKVDKTL